MGNPPTMVEEIIIDNPWLKGEETKWVILPPWGRRREQKSFTQGRKGKIVLSFTQWGENENNNSPFKGEEARGQF